MKTTTTGSPSSAASNPVRGIAASLGMVLILLHPGVSRTFAASAIFVQKDTVTQGTWIRIPTGSKIYGAEGFLMRRNEFSPISALPAYVTGISSPGFMPYAWRFPDTANPVSDLQIPEAPYTTRAACGWYFWPEFQTDNVIVMNLSDNQPHLMAIYFQDADSTERRQTIEIRDAAGDTLLDTRSLDAPFDQGVWLQWKITGSIRIKIILTGGPNTAHMGYFFDADPGTAYMNWLTRFTFAPGGNRMPAADTDGDGLINQQEFAFGLDPTKASSCNPIVSPLNGNTRKFRYTRLAGSTLGYVVTTSIDLLTWKTDNAATAGQTVTGTLDGIETVEVTLTPAVPPGKQFVRIKAE